MTPILPQAAREQHAAVLGKSGSGKTYAAKAVIVEPLLDAGKHVVIVDPTSAWWGLRSSADGKGPGFKVIVLGGDHGDLPLPALGGAAVARLAIEQRANIVCDTGNLTVGERTRWAMDFAGALYRLNRAPLYLILDEAHNFAPQGKVPDPDTGKMLHAVNQIASGGRSRGIRLTMITQRPQKLHKDALTTADTLIAMRVLAPHDREAVKAWVDGCGDPGQGKQVLDSLAGLKRGEGWVWYPEGGHLVRAHFPRIRTFDSSATPTEGQRLEQPKGAADVDLTEIRAALADAVKEAQDNDPKLLRAEIARLKAQTRGAPGASKDELAAEYGRGRVEGFASALRAMQPAIERLTTLHGAVTEQIDCLLSDMRKHVDRAPAPRAPAPAQRTPDAPRPAADMSAVGSAKQRILDALAWLEAVGITRAEKVQLALLADQSPKSSGYANNLGALRSAGLIEYPSGGQVALTKPGREAANAPARPPTTEDLHRTLESRLPAPQWRILKVVIGYYPEAIAKPALAAEAGQSASSSGYANNLGALRSLGFIDYPRGGEVAALPVLFLER